MTCLRKVTFCMFQVSISELQAVRRFNLSCISLAFVFLITSSKVNTNYSNKYLFSCMRLTKIKKVIISGAKGNVRNRFSHTLYNMNFCSFYYYYYEFQTYIKEDNGIMNSHYISFSPLLSL